MPIVPGNFSARFLVVGLLLVAASHWAADTVVALLVPAIRAELTLLEPNLTIDSLESDRQQGRDSLTLSANLAYPLYVGTRVIEPIGWRGTERGYFRVHLSAQGVLLAPLVLLSALFSWPAAGVREGAARAAVGIPLAAVLLAVDSPLDLLGNFRHAVIHHAGLQPVIPSFVWAQFLEGGGSVALALAGAVAAIALARRISHRNPRAG